MIKKISIIIAIVLIAGLSGILADHFLFPYLATTNIFQRYRWLEKSVESVTVINKTEQVYVKEDSSVAKLMSPVASSVVNIISYPNLEVKGAVFADKFKNGTGVIATSDGMIMTYSSALNFAKIPKTGIMEYKYRVMTADGNLYDADFVGIDSWSNLAFLKINASNLPVISFGDFDNYKAGEKVIAIGNDYTTYQNRFSTGIINSFDPTFNIAGLALDVSEKLEGVFVSDFSVENLSVGSPIVDYSGQVVGLVGAVPQQNGLKYFQISSDKIKDVLDKTIQKQLDTNPILGIYYVPVTKTLIATQNLSVADGAMVYSSSGQQGLAVISGTPAAASGLKIGDIITKINDTDINLENNLSSVLYNYKKGDKIHLTLQRGGQQTELDVQL